MTVEIFDCEQGSPEWFDLRRGIVTASEFKTILGIKKEAREKATRDLYMRKLAGEIITGLPMDSYQNDHMERGKREEHEARDLYAMIHDVDPVRVGFVRNGKAGCSPDSLIGEDGGLEIKSALPHIQIERLLKDVLPPEHRAQVQGSLWLAERDRWDFVSYSPKLPMFVKTVRRDEEYIREIADAADTFSAELAEMVERIKRYGGGWKADLKASLAAEPVNLLMAG